MNKDRLILITNPGSSSRKYALYKGSELICSLHFEFEGKEIVCTTTRSEERRVGKECRSRWSPYH